MFLFYQVTKSTETSGAIFKSTTTGQGGGDAKVYVAVHNSRLQQRLAGEDLSFLKATIGYPIAGMCRNYLIEAPSLPDSSREIYIEVLVLKCY